MRLTVSVQKKLGQFQFAADFDLAGHRVGLFGPSGSGKSTLMHLLAGLLRPDCGSIRLDDTVLFDSARGIDLAPEQRRVGVVFQHSLLFPHLSVRRNLLYGWRRTAEAEQRIDPETIIEVLHLGHLLDRGVNLLSGGERQRVALGRTILACPRLILLDEPLSGLDEELKLQIMPYLNTVVSRFAMPLVFISHSLLEMRLMTEQVLVVAEGAGDPATGHRGSGAIGLGRAPAGLRQSAPPGAAGGAGRSLSLPLGGCSPDPHRTGGQRREHL